MKIRLLTPLIFLAALFMLGSRTHKDVPDFFLGGIQVNEADYDRWTQTISDAGMNTVEVTVYAKQGDWDSDNLWYDDENEGVVAEIQAAKKKGLKVVLILRVALDHAFERNKFLWHGMIQPKTDSLVDNWFWRYRYFVAKWAQISQEEGVDALVVGSELNALSATIPVEKTPALLDYYGSRTKQNLWEKRVLRFEDQLKESHLWVRGFDNYSNPENYIDDRITANKQWADQVGYGLKGDHIKKINKRRDLLRTHWVRLILETRRIYKGQLSYAANFDNYHEVDFWPHLDFLGVNAYFPLREVNETFSNDTEMQSAFRESWKEIFGTINDFKDENGLSGKPIVFTELGYIYRENSAVAPWKGFGFSVVGPVGREKLLIWKEQKENRTERALAVRALKQAIDDTNFPLKGILYWKLTTHDYHIPYEPFVLHIAKEPVDELQPALAAFLKN